MKENDSFEKIAEKLAEAELIYLFPHENPDGDAVGSSAALCSMLRGMGKDCRVLIDEKLPDNLEFMDDGMFVIPEEGIEAPDLSAAVDCSETGRFPKLREIFLSAPYAVSIDHHINDDPCGDMNYVDPESASAGELIYKLMKVMDHKPSKKEAEALYAAIATDTGNFQYSNTKKETHEAVCGLFDSGIDVSSVSAALYENESPQKTRLIGMALAGMRFYADGKIAAASVTRDMLKRAGAVMSDAEPVVAQVRSVAGVEIAAVLKEREEGKVFVSLRSKNNVDVRKLAASFGGGGHVKAAGCTIDTDIETAEKEIVETAEAMLSESENQL